MGSFFEGVADGKGKGKCKVGCYYYANGDRYEGEWFEGNAAGKGFALPLNF